MNNLNQNALLVEQTAIRHTAYSFAVSQLDRLFNEVQRTHEPIYLALLGESRTGKSRVIEEMLGMYPPSRTSEGRTVPVLRVGVPAKPTPKSLAEKALRAIGDPRYSKGTENEKTERLKMLLQHCGVRMLVLNECQHIVDQGTQAAIYHTSDWIKSLVEETSEAGWNMALVLVGLPYGISIINQNEQLQGRFRAAITMPRFNWLEDGDRAQFVAVLRGFRKKLSSEFDLPAIDGDDLAFLFWCGTGGLIGYVVNTLKILESNARTNNQRSLTMSDLAEAHEEAVWRAGRMSGIPSPFRDPGQYNSENDVLISEVLRIGVRECPPERGGRRDRRIRSVNEVLVP